MVKTIRISEENHTKLIKLQGQIQAEREETTSMDDTIDILLLTYKMKTKRRKK